MSGEPWREFFAHPDYVGFVSRTLTPERTAAELAALRDLLDLRPGTRVLDLGCGQGRLAVPLARAGCAVTGLDASAPLLDRLREAAGAAGVPVPVIHADYTELAAVAEFDVVLSMGTAFGYVETPGADLAALRAARRALVPGGRLLIDTENRDRVVRNNRRIWFDMGGTVIWCDRSFDPLTGRWREVLRWVDDAGRHEHGYGLRLYALSELAALLEAASFTVVRALGEVTGAPYDLDSPRLVVLAEAG